MAKLHVICNHVFDGPTMTCSYCGLTAEAIEMGRDKPATWDDVDKAFSEGLRIGRLGERHFFRHHRRRKLVILGAWLQLRQIERSLTR